MGLLYGRRNLMAKHIGPALWVMLAAVFVIGGCATTPAAPPPADMDELGPPEILYRAIVSTYESRKIPIALSSDKFMLVTSDFEAIGQNLRRRMASRVVRAAPGAMGLQVTVEWERRTEIDGRQSWRPIDNESLRERAKPTELELGRAIERRFESWKEQWKESKGEG
jgi:hypothetical protein